jgi:hypothetical protein
VLQPEERHVINKNAAIFDRGNSRVSLGTATRADEMYAKVISYVCQAEAVNAEIGIAQMVMRLFFYIASQPEPSTWFAFSRCTSTTSSRDAKISNDAYDKLHAQLVAYLPWDMQRGREGKAKFRDSLKAWRSDGSFLLLLGAVLVSGAYCISGYVHHFLYLLFFFH